MANNTTFSKPMPPSSNRSKKKKSRNIPPAVITTDIQHSKSAPIDSHTMDPSHSIPPKYKRKGAGTPNSYRFQIRGPPKKALPNISQTPQPTSKPSFNRIPPQIYSNNHSDTPPLPLEMSQTTHVDINNTTGNRHLNHPMQLQPKTKIKKTLSSNDITDYVPVTNTYNRANTLPKYKNINGNINNNNHVKNISIISNDSGVFIPPPPHNNMHNNGYSKGHKRKKSKRKSKTNSDQIDFIPKTEINVNYSNERNKNPTIDTMKHLIERAETFGQTGNKHSNKSNQIHSNQAPQIPQNNSIFDESTISTDDNSDIEYKNNNNNINRQSLSNNVHLPSNINNVVNNNSNDKYIREQMNGKNNEMKINELKNEIDDLQMLLNNKRKQLNMLEKEQLESNIECIKPITLLKRINAFCDVANDQELDMIQCILAQSV